MHTFLRPSESFLCVYCKLCHISHDPVAWAWSDRKLWCLKHELRSCLRDSLCLLPTFLASALLISPTSVCWVLWAMCWHFQVPFYDAFSTSVVIYCGEHDNKMHCAVRWLHTVWSVRWRSVCTVCRPWTPNVPWTVCCQGIHSPGNVQFIHPSLDKLACWTAWFSIVTVTLWHRIWETNFRNWYLLYVKFVLKIVLTF